MAKKKRTYRFSDRTLFEIEAIRRYLEEKNNVKYHNTTVLESLVSEKYKQINEGE